MAAGAGRRLFVSRSKSASRQIENEDEVFAIAETYGFTRVFPQDLNFNDQLALFAGAEAVAGALGAGLANAAFLAPGGLD
ncbi:glycosyltransferase 61 family protein [Paeniroseomonas aquatica]|uniref:glycosyltransferase 61 family protein n=1 Tax=Paeniroseomonas aquatica TaxID=373043 RepID=UPI003609E063